MNDEARYHSRDCMDAYMLPCRCGADEANELAAGSRADLMAKVKYLSESNRALNGICESRDHWRQRAVEAEELLATCKCQPLKVALTTYIPEAVEPSPARDEVRTFIDAGEYTDICQRALEADGS